MNHCKFLLSHLRRELHHVCLMSCFLVLQLGTAINARLNEMGGLMIDAIVGAVIIVWPSCFVLH